MKSSFIALAAAALLAAGAAHAQSGPEVVKAKGCLNCHDVETKKAGPALKDVAAKYRSDKDAPKALAAKLKEGKGHMKVAASDAEIAAVLQYVLAQK